MSQTKRIVVYRLYLKRLMISNYLMLKTRAASVLNGLWVRLITIFILKIELIPDQIYMLILWYVYIIYIMICLYHMMIK